MKKSKAKTRSTKAKKLDGLGEALAQQERYLAEAHRMWATMVEKIRLNPNQMNPDGVWMRSQLADLQLIHTAIKIRTTVVEELRSLSKSL